MKLKNHRSRAKISKRQRTNVEQFSKRLDKLFDIANCAALKNLPKNLQKFLTDCRKGNRNIHLPAIDVLPEGTSGNPSAMEEEIPNKEEIGMKLSQQSSFNSFCSSISNSSEWKRTCSDFEDTIPEPKKNKIDILTSELVLALDRTKTSNRNAMYIISAVIKSLGLDIDKYNLSYSTIRNACISKREEIVDTIKEEEIFDDSLVVHWDGKVLPAGNGQSKAERLSIHVTGINTDINLKTPILSDGTGESQASAIFETLTEWDLCDNVKAMCFDTTSSNTGCFNGACALLEDKIGRDLLYLACRHHSSELMLRNVAEVAWPVTNSPNVPIFKRLRDNWEKIDKSAYGIGTEDTDIALILNQRKDDILDFIENQLKINDSWNRIADTMGVPVPELKKKKDNLLATFRLNLKRKLSSIKSGAGAEEVYQPVWIFYDTQPVVNEDSNVRASDIPPGAKKGDDDDADVLATPQNNPIIHGQKRRAFNPPELQEASRKMNTASNTLNSALTSEQSLKEKDQCDLFCRMLAKQIKEYPKLERDEIMYEIHDVMMNRRRRYNSMMQSRSYTVSSPSQVVLSRPSTSNSVYLSTPSPNFVFDDSPYSVESNPQNEVNQHNINILSQEVIIPSTSRAVYENFGNIVNNN
ncbi:hypothetical protein JTB14_015375 [Gonioctena quinquepunctata]|nr:hypothetical protein JTB14_015375 [Gonioctena quinquepunctata]